MGYESNKNSFFNFEKREALRLMLMGRIPVISADIIFNFLVDSENDEEIQCAAVRLLSRLKHPAIFSFLISAVNTPRTKQKASYIKCLRELGNPAASLSLLKFLIDKNKEIRLSTALSFASFGEDSMRLLVKHWLTLGREERVLVLRTFGEFVLGGGALFSEAAKDKDWWIRLEVVKLLKGSNAPFVENLLLDLLKDEHYWVRLESVRAFKGLRGKKNEVALSSLLNDPNLEVISAVQSVLSPR